MGLRGRFVQSAIPTHSKKRQAEFHKYVAALPQRSGKEEAALREMYHLRSVLLLYKKTSTWLQVTSMVHGGGTKSGADHQVDSTQEEAFKNARISCATWLTIEGARQGFRASGLMHVALSSDPSLRQSASHENTVHVKSIVKSQVSLHKTRPAITRIHRSHVSTRPRPT